MDTVIDAWGDVRAGRVSLWAFAILILELGAERCNQPEDDRRRFLAIERATERFVSDGIDVEHYVSLVEASIAMPHTVALSQQYPSPSGSLPLRGRRPARPASRKSPD